MVGQFRVKNVDFTYSDQGRGKAVVFLHGYLENRKMWHRLAGDLPEGSWRKICLDLPGHGDSGNLGYVHSMEEMAEVVSELLRHLKLKKAAVCGHSMGGYVALAFAEKYPEKVRGVILVSSTARADTEEKKKGRDRAVQLAKRNHKGYIRSAIPMLFRPKNRRALRDEVNWAKEQALQTSRQGVIAALEGMKIRPDREVILNFGGFPVFMLAAENDPVIPIDVSREQITQSGIKSHIVENGHMSHLEDYDEFLKGIKGFLKDVD